MIITNETQFAKLSENGSRALQNSYVYIMSPELKLTNDDSDANELIVGSAALTDELRPKPALLAQLANGDLSKKKFKKAYKKQLKSAEAQFMIYTIMRSLNEKSYFPVFVASNAEWETGYLKVFANVLTKRFGLTRVKVSDHLRKIKDLWKQSKKSKSKNVKPKKEFKRLIKGYIRDTVQLSFDGVKLLEELDAKFAIERIMLLLNQSDSPSEIKTKQIVRSIVKYSEHNKKAKKRVEAGIKSLGISKKPERWNHADASNLAAHVYATIYQESTGAND